MKTKPGFTLIEVLVTIFILAVVVLTLISVFIYGFNLLARTRQVSLATQIGQEEVERFRNMRYVDLLALGESPSFTQESLALVGDQQKFLNGQGLIRIENDLGVDYIRKISVSITWDYRGRNMRKDVVTYVTREGINRR